MLTRGAVRGDRSRQYVFSVGGAGGGFKPEGQDAGKRGVPGGHGDRSRGTGALIMREPAVFVFSA
ncbi:MAG TPA: hypothetical protein DHV46_11440 [Desulfovibrio piger]|uniref:Uncharacterized protein n=1 Tax=Desulfovibrio piger ATCC 29098 TaxID=411464 RepID=B6WUZ1_9BACT|nr:hypothetical protein DESPIG_01906 [Desulfovibrio piger ATCC 29098]HCZ45119.1 hypothetical protein [Desulfovibrio piger]